MKTDFGDQDILRSQRPSFLTWLCILTFIGSGWAIVNSIFSYSMAGKSVQMFNAVDVKTDSVKLDSSALDNADNDAFFSRKTRKSLEKLLSKENIEKQALGRLLAAIFTLGGALLMWKLRRSGFYFYVLGVLITIAIPFYLFGTDLIAVGASLFSGFFGLVFIALYALNLSAMKRIGLETAHKRNF